MAFAVIAADQVPYFLTRGGRFYMQNAPDMPAPGDEVVANGDIQEKQDIAGKTFQTIELTALSQAKS